MRILGIETSCDETAIAIIDIGSPSTSSGTISVKVLANIVSSQAKLHAKFGGVVPNLAKREHQRNLVPVLLASLREAKLLSSKLKTQNSKKLPATSYQLQAILEREPELFARIREHVLPLRPPEIDAITVTVGPGLAPALWVGVNFTRVLAYLWKKPIIPVNHLEGHIYTNLLAQAGKFKAQSSKLKTFVFPALCLIVSGGHTELVLMRGYGKYKVIGETLDDAAGEAFDKVAKMMNLGFPGGPAIARLAEQWKSKITNPKFQTIPKSQIQNSKQANKLGIKLPRPMINSKDFNFSFSGLKTAVLYLLRDLKGKYPLSKIRPAMANEFQQAVVDVLISKTLRAAKKFKVKTVIIGGGVAANNKLRRELGNALLKTLPAISYKLPAIPLTGDNALMIALAGYFCRDKKAAWRSLQADANLRLG